MFRAEASKAKNLLRVTYSGCVRPEHTKNYASELPLILAELDSGFRLLTDMSTLEEMDVACMAHVEGMMDLCSEKGVSLVVRVIPDPTKDIGMNIMSRFHYDRSVRIVTCETVEEALKLLV